MSFLFPLSFFYFFFLWGVFKWIWVGTDQTGVFLSSRFFFWFFGFSFVVHLSLSFALFLVRGLYRFPPMSDFLPFSLPPRGAKSAFVQRCCPSLFFPQGMYWFVKKPLFFSLVFPPPFFWFWAFVYKVLLYINTVQCNQYLLLVTAHDGGIYFFLHKPNQPF